MMHVKFREDIINCRGVIPFIKLILNTYGHSVVMHIKFHQESLFKTRVKNRYLNIYYCRNKKIMPKKKKI